MGLNRVCSYTRGSNKGGFRGPPFPLPVPNILKQNHLIYILYGLNPPTPYNTIVTGPLTLYTSQDGVDFNQAEIAFAIPQPILFD